MDVGYEGSDHQKKIEEKYASQLSVGEYIKKDVIGSLVTLGAGVVGGVAGWMLGKSAFKGKSLNLGGFSLGIEFVTSYGGVLLGTILGGIPSTYNMWRKKEASQLAVQELNEDIAGMAAIRAKTNPDLVKEMDSLRGMYDELKAENARLHEQAKHHRPNAIEKALADGPRSHHDHAEHHASASEAAR